MDTTKKKIEVQAHVRVVGKIKGQELTRPENFKTIVEVDRASIFAPALHQANIFRATVQSFEDHFRARMRADPSEKHRIGGIRWIVDIIHISYKDAV